MAEGRLDPEDWDPYECFWDVDALLEAVGASAKDRTVCMNAQCFLSLAAAGKAVETSHRVECIDCLEETVFVANEAGELYALRHGDGGIFNHSLDIPVTVSVCHDVVLSEEGLSCVEPDELLTCGAPWEGRQARHRTTMRSIAPPARLPSHPL